MGGTLQQVDLGGGRGWLAPDPHLSIARLDARLGHRLQITEAGRTWEQQKAHWDHFKKYGSPIALHPNTPSLHQIGNAIDSDEAQEFVDLMQEYGWRRTVYRWVNGKYTLVEPWHFEYFPAEDQHRHEGAPVAPITPKSEEDDMPVRVDINGKAYLVGPRYIKHMDTPASRDDTTTIMGTRVFPLTDNRKGEAWANVLKENGIPAGVLNGQGLVLDPLKNTYSHGNLWTGGLSELAEIKRLMGK